MENKQFESLSDEDLSQVTGGDDDVTYFKKCKTCKGQNIRGFRYNDVYYYMWRCDKCGREFYIKGDKEIQPSQWFQDMNASGRQF